MAPTLFLLCGLPGSGKTTRAHELQAESGATLLNGDSWICRLYPADAEAAARDERRPVVEQLQWDVVEELLTGGVSVVLDWGLWTRAERDDYRQRAHDLGAQVQLVFLDAPPETLHERIAARNRDLPPGTFHVSTQELDEWIELFEPPTQDELLLTTRTTGDDLSEFALGLETQVWQALVDGDSAADNALLTPDFLGVYPTGFATRDEHAGQLADGPTIAEFTLSQATTAEPSRGHLRLSYLATYRRPQSQLTERMYVTSLWERRNDAWVNSFSQDTPAD